MHFLHSLSHGRNRLSIVGSRRVLNCLALLIGQSMPCLPVPLMYPYISPYLSLMTIEALVLGFPFFFFSIVATESNYIRVIP